MRVKGWEKRILREIDVVLTSPFDWATNNCGHTIAASIRACLGDHPVLTHLSGCKDEQTVLDILGREGGLKGILEGYFDRLPTPVLAQQGDVGIVRGLFRDRHSGEMVQGDVGCIFLDGKAVGLRERGVFRIPPTKVDLAFRIE